MCTFADYEIDHIYIYALRALDLDRSIARLIRDLIHMIINREFEANCKKEVIIYRKIDIVGQPGRGGRRPTYTCSTT